MEKSSIQPEEDSFHQEIGLNLRKKLVKCYIWSIALYGAETWTLRKVEQKYLESLKCAAGERCRRSVGPIV
jgi:predicted HD phosphohydrolase